MDKKELPDRILGVLRANRAKLQLKELREALPQFRDLADQDFFAALGDLHSDGMIEATFVRTGLYDEVRAEKLGVQKYREIVSQSNGWFDPILGWVAVKREK